MPDKRSRDVLDVQLPTMAEIMARIRERKRREAEEEAAAAEAEQAQPLEERIMPPSGSMADLAAMEREQMMSRRMMPSGPAAADPASIAARTMAPSGPAAMDPNSVQSRTMAASGPASDPRAEAAKRIAARRQQLIAGGLSQQQAIAKMAEEGLIDPRVAAQFGG